MNTGETRESCRKMPLSELIEYHDDLVEQSRIRMSKLATESVKKHWEG